MTHRAIDTRSKRVPQPVAPGSASRRHTMSTHRRREQPCGGSGEQVMGVGENIKGVIKEKTGDVIDDDQLKAEGDAQQTKGRSSERTRSAQRRRPTRRRPMRCLASRMLSRAEPRQHAEPGHSPGLCGALRESRPGQPRPGQRRPVRRGCCPGRPGRASAPREPVGASRGYPAITRPGHREPVRSGRSVDSCRDLALAAPCAIDTCGSDTRGHPRATAGGRPRLPRLPRLVSCSGRSRKLVKWSV
jgi:uncharacterized protein YjbJ (UPF0337 family)